MSEEMSERITWTTNLEQYLASISEKSHCLSWLHKNAESLFSMKKVPIDLAVIIGSAILGFLNAGSSTLFQGKSEISSVALGIGSLLVSTLNTITTYFGYSKRCEGHRLSAIYYAKLHRFLAIELNLPRTERIQPSDLLKMTKDQFDRLAETSPPLPKESIAEFRKRFSSAKYEDVSKPEEANGLEKVEVYKDHQEPSTDLRIRVPPQSLARQNSGFESPVAVFPRSTKPLLPLQAQAEAPKTDSRPAVEVDSESVSSSQSHSEAI